MVLLSTGLRSRQAGSWLITRKKSGMTNFPCPLPPEDRKKAVYSCQFICLSPSPKTVPGKIPDPDFTSLTAGTEDGEKLQCEGSQNPELSLTQAIGNGSSAFLRWSKGASGA